MGPVTAEQQVEALRKVLEPLPEGVRRKVAGWMLAGLENEQKVATEKALMWAMKGTSGVAATQHLGYVGSLEPVVEVLREYTRPENKPAAMARPRVV